MKIFVSFHNDEARNLFQAGSVDFTVAVRSSDTEAQLARPSDLPVTVWESESTAITAVEQGRAHGLFTSSASLAAQAEAQLGNLFSFDSETYAYTNEMTGASLGTLAYELDAGSGGGDTGSAGKFYFYFDSPDSIDDEYDSIAEAIQKLEAGEPPNLRMTYSINARDHFDPPRSYPLPYGEVQSALNTGIIDAYVTPDLSNIQKITGPGQHYVLDVASGQMQLLGDTVFEDQSYTGDEGTNALVGEGGNDSLAANGGNDSLKGNGGDDTLNGGTGLDTALYSGPHSQFVINLNPSGASTATDQSGTEGTDMLIGVERLQFSDGVLALDTDGVAGQVYRLYQAAFGREPDTVGLSSNINLVDNGMSLHDMANAFASSAEFQALFGANSSDAEYINALYNNVLGRDADAVGLAGWLNALAIGSDRGHVLTGFSDSPENIALVAPAIEDGIWLG